MIERLENYVNMLQRTLCVCQRYNLSSAKSRHINSYKSWAGLEY